MPTSLTFAGTVSTAISTTVITARTSIPPHFAGGYYSCAASACAVLDASEEGVGHYCGDCLKVFGAFGHEGAS